MSTPVIVFVHGIRSNCGEAFSMLAASIKADERFRGWELMWCNYDWGYGVRLGASRLHDVLDFANSRAGEDGVYIVAHSMGGLVARAALLERSYPSVRRLIMLATPNFGAISTAQLSLFFQPVADVVFSLNGIYPKKRAYYDLTHTRELFQSERMARRKIENEYATVPAGYYHADRKGFDVGFRSKDNREFTGVLIAAELISKAFPSRMPLSRPHDGIVSMESASLIPATVRWSEKQDAIFNARPTYANIVHTRAEDVNHNTILRDDQFIELVMQLIYCESLKTWYDSMDRTHDVEVDGLGL